MGSLLELQELMSSYPTFDFVAKELNDKDADRADTLQGVISYLFDILFGANTAKPDIWMRSSSPILLVVRLRSGSAVSSGARIEARRPPHSRCGRRHMAGGASVLSHK